MHSRFKRAGMRWKQPGFLHVLALRLTSLNRMFEAFWASRGLAVQAAVAPTKRRHTRPAPMLPELVDPAPHIKHALSDLALAACTQTGIELFGVTTQDPAGPNSSTRAMTILALGDINPGRNSPHPYDRAIPPG